MTKATFALEKIWWQKGFQAIVGIDEVGRGSWAGPVVVGGVIFPQFANLSFELFDSKLLDPKRREETAQKIKASAAGFAVAEIEPSIINRVGVGRATQMAFRKVLKRLEGQYDFVFMDAFYVGHVKRALQYAIPKGDTLSASIAAASIIAKVHRDAIMKRFDRLYPAYGFAIHKGYGTKLHQKAMREYGVSKIHRTSFRIGQYACSATPLKTSKS